MGLPGGEHLDEFEHETSSKYMGLLFITTGCRQKSSAETAVNNATYLFALIEMHIACV